MERIKLVNRWNNSKVHPHEYLFIRKKPTLVDEDGEKESYVQSTLRILTSKTIIVYFSLLICILLILTAIDIYVFSLNAGTNVSLGGDIFMNSKDLSMVLDISTPMSSYLSSYFVSDGGCRIYYGEKIAELKLNFLQEKSRPSKINLKSKMIKTEYHGLRELVWDKVGNEDTSKVSEFHCSSSITIRLWGFLYLFPLPINKSFGDERKGSKLKLKKTRKLKVSDSQLLQNESKKSMKSKDTPYSLEMKLGLENLFYFFLTKTDRLFLILI